MAIECTFCSEEIPDELIVKKGKQANIPAPLNEAAASVFKKIEQGELRPGLSTLKLLEKKAKAAHTI